ncbi:hypothetical protein L7F22_034106 [Adiantum nelumboides]|nr:hypothetical protein [Adiantum nelumboides]
MIQALNANTMKLKNQRDRLSGFATALDGHKMAAGNERLANRLHCVEGDQLRSEAGEAMRDMLTGDSLDVANNVQRKLGPIDVPAQLFLKDKVELLKQLKAAGLTGMVGDGINDAPALAAADVGIAMGVVVGYASLWGAVLLEDVGTCLLVIFNSMLLLERKKDESRCLGLFAFRRKRRSKVCQTDVLLSSEKYVDLEAEPWCPKKVEDNKVSAHDEGLLVSSDAADVGSEVRDSLLGDNSEGDVESIRYQELASYAPAHGTVRSQDFSSKEGRHVEVESAPIFHLDKHEDERDMILQYYSEEWGHSKESGQMDVTGRSNLDLGPLAHLGVWALKFASVQSYKHFIAEFQNCSFNNTYLLEATEENKIKVLGKDFGGENLANFDSFPSSEEGPFKFNMIGKFGRQNGSGFTSLDQEEVQVHAVNSSTLSKESERSSAENREALFSNIEVCKPETEAGHGRWLCASQLMDPLIEQKSTLKAQAEAVALILSNGKKLPDDPHESPGLGKGQGLGPGPRKSQG